MIKKRFNKYSKIKKRNNSCIKSLIYSFIFIFKFVVLITIFINYYYIKKRFLNLEGINNVNNKNKFNILSNITPENEEFNQKINDKYIEQQNYFCDNQNLFYNNIIEGKIKLTPVRYEDKNYNMFVYSKSDYVSQDILLLKQWESKSTKVSFDALNYYSNKKKIANKDIYILDIGANIGWYTFLFGKYGYKVISFEPSKINDYILRKNYCINKEVNITIINKGLYNEEKKCDLYNTIYNEGNGITICENNTIPNHFPKNKTGEIILTKLNNYIPYLSDKNLALIKIDIEGSEGKAFEGGIELVTKYHVPFIFLEFTPATLELHETDPLQFLQLFIDNGYKMGFTNFFKDFISTTDIMKMDFKNYGLKNMYIVHSKILE